MGTKFCSAVLQAAIAVLFSTSAFAQRLTPKPHEALAPYWTAEPGWSTEIQLRNNLTQAPLTVTPVLRLADGREIKLAPVTIAPATVVSVDAVNELSKLAPNLVGTSGAFGSIIFQYTSLTAKNLYAVVMVKMQSQPIGYHIDASPISKKAFSGSREGIWWLPRAGTRDFLVISNGADKTVNGKLSLYDASGKEWNTTVKLGAHQAARFVVSDLVRSAGLAGSYGGIKFTVPESAGAVDSVHFLYDPVAGFSALMKMFDRDPAAKLEERTWAGNTQWTQWAPMLALRNPDPVIGLPQGTVFEPMGFLRNTTSKTIMAKMTLGWRGDSGSGKTALDAMILRPFETLRVDIGAMQPKLGIPDNAHWALVTLTTPASPDDLIAVAASYDSTGRYGAQTPFSDQLSEHWVGGLWQVDATHNTIAAVTNGGTRATDALLTLFYDGGKQKYAIQRSLAAGEQMWLNFGDLIRNQAPDRNGKVLPINLTSGTYELRDLNPGRNHGGNLFEGKVIVDKTWGHLTYGCMTCCGYNSPWYDPGSLGLAIGSSDQPTTWATDGCSGYSQSINDFATSWWTNSTAIATVSQGVVTGVGIGSTGNYGRGPLQGGDGRDIGRYRQCPIPTTTASNMVMVVNVQVTTADIVNDQIVVSLSPTNVSGTLVVTTGGAGPNPAIFNGTVSGGTYTYSFKRGSLAIGQYTTVNATWTVNGTAVSGSKAVSFDVLGLYRHSQYNTPNETACGGSPSKAYITNSSCTFSQNTLLSDFISQTNLNGSGISINFGTVLKEQFCLNQGPPDDSGISFRGNSSIVPACGSGFSVSSATVAVNPVQLGAGNIYQCGDQLLLVTSAGANQAVKTVTDKCPACSSGFNGTSGHIDDYSTSAACSSSGVGDYGNFITIRLR